MNIFDLPNYDESKSDSEHTTNERMSAKKELELLITQLDIDHDCRLPFKNCVTCEKWYSTMSKLQSEYELTMRDGKVYFK